MIVFYTVAKRLSFSKASEELFISQPAITKHIKELEAKYKIKLFDRAGNRNVFLTEAGKTMLDFVEQLYNISRKMDFEMDHLSKRYKGKLTVGASSTISQYVLPRYLAKFYQKFPEINIQLITGNTEDIQNALLRKKIDLGIVEGTGKIPEIHYEDFLDDEIVLVSKNTLQIVRKNTISLHDLQNYPLVVRENGSGTLRVIADYLSRVGLKISDLKIEMQLGSTEGIKNYLLESHCLALVSIHSVLQELKNATLKIIDLKECKMERKFRFISHHGHPDALTSVFKKFLNDTKTVL